MERKTKHKREGGKRKKLSATGTQGRLRNMVDIHDDGDEPEYAFTEEIKSKRKLKSSLEDVS